MRLTLAEPRFFKDSISIISEIVSEARFKVTKNSIELIAMDPANVALVVFKLLSSAFTEYDVKEPVELSVNLINLKQIMRRIGSNDMLTLELSGDSKLKVQIKGVNTRTFSLPLIDIEEKEQKIPELNFPVTIETSCSSLVDAIEDAIIVSDSVAFMCEDEKFLIDAEGDSSRATVEITQDTKVTAGKEKYRAKYSIDYLKKMVAGAKLTDKVKINFNTDYPLRLEFTSVNKLQMIFILAPRVEND